MHYGVILNDTRSLARIGSLDAAPYHGAPRAPVLYIKPANTVAGEGANVHLPAGASSVEVAATVGLVIARHAARLTPANALGHVGEVALACDLSLPHASYYRPPIREKCFDGSLVLGPRARLDDISALVLTTRIGAELVDTFALGDLVRDAARLLVDVTEFMTLNAGDVLLVGVLYRAPEARPGDAVRIEAAGLGGLAFTIARNEG